LSNIANNKDVLSQISKYQSFNKDAYAIVHTSKGYESTPIGLVKKQLSENTIHSIHINSLQLPQFQFLPVFSLTLDIAGKSINIECKHKPNWITYCTVMNSEQDYGRFTTRMILQTKRLLKFAFDYQHILVLYIAIDFIVDIKGQIYMIDIYDLITQEESSSLLPKYLELLQNSIMIPNKNKMKARAFTNENAEFSQRAHTMSRIQLKKVVKLKPEIEKSNVSKCSSRISERANNMHSSGIMEINLVKSKSPNKFNASRISRVSKHNSIASSHIASRASLSEYLTRAVSIAHICPIKNDIRRSLIKFKLTKASQYVSHRESNTIAAKQDSPLYINKTLSERKIKKTTSYLSAISRIRSTLRNIHKTKPKEQSVL
jgi:hypothetical protein